MRKELYKLILVFIMISFSFALAFFIGREVTLAGQKNKSQKHSSTSSSMGVNHTSSFKKENIHPPKQLQKTKPTISPQTLPNQPQATATPNGTEENIQKPTADQLTSNQNAPTNNVKTTTTKDSVIYGLFIANYQNKNQAMDKATQIKLRFPQWRIFVKRSGPMYTVYIGPFRKKELVQRFLHEIEDKKDFPSIRIEKIIIKKSKNKTKSSE